MEKLKVLVVDDAAFIRDMVRKTVRSRFPGMAVEEAINGRKAQQLISKQSFDLILCDWEMPEMSGIELLNWLRKEHQADTPFVMVTSRGDKENVVEAIQAGVTDYIGKPFSSEKLLGKVIKVMSKRHNLREMEGTGPGGKGRLGDGSVSALTGGAPPPRPRQAAQESPLISKPASQPAPKPAAMPKQTAAKGSAHLRFGDAVNQCIIKALSLKQISLVCRAQDGVPAILEPVVIDLQQGEGGGDIARINAYVHQLQAAEPSMDSSLINIIINVVDQDPEKLAYLSRMIARGTSTGKYVPGA